MLKFPNDSRSYDPTRYCVRFCGHDGALEISFFVGEDALLLLKPSAALGESSLLETFDRNHERIIRTAFKVYEGRRRESYELTESDF